MSDRDWDAEMAKIDRQLASISDEQLVAEQRAAGAKLPPGEARKAVAPRGAVASPAPSVAPAPPSTVRGAWRGWVQALVALGAAAGLWFWPWPAQCGMPLFGFVAATAAVALLGVWSATGTWRHRLGAAHVLSLLVVLSSLVIGAREVLPRVGYALPDTARGPGWSCVLPAPSVTPPAVTPPGATPEGQPATQPSA